MMGLSMTGYQPDSKFIAATLKPLRPWLTASVSPPATQVVRTEDNVPLHYALLGEAPVPQPGEQAPLLPSQNHSLVPWDQPSQLPRLEPDSPDLACACLGSEWRSQFSWRGASATRSTGRGRATVVSGKSHGNVDLKVVHKNLSAVKSDFPLE